MSTKTYSASNRRRGVRRCRAGAPALMAAGVCALAGVPAAPAANAEPPSTTIAAEAPGASASATLSVANPTGKAAELLRKLTIAQLASLLKTSPAQLRSTLEAAAGGALGGIVGELLAKPGATVEEVVKLLGENGLSSAPVEQALAPLVAKATETAGQVQGVVSSALSDLAQSGGLAALAHELALPVGVVEAVKLVPSTAAQAAETLGTTTSHLSSALVGAGAVAAPLGGFSPVATSSVERVSSASEHTETTGTTLLVGSPTGTGGVTFTTVNSTSTSPSGAVASAGISNAFSIVSVKVTRSGAIVETVRLPGPGLVSAVASANKALARRSAHARSRSVTRKVKVASAAASTSGGTLTLTLHPRGVGSSKATRIAISTTYTPTGGSPRTLTRSVISPRRGSGRHG